MILLVIAVSSEIAVAQQLIMTAPPRESPEDGQKLFAPLAAQLSKELGIDIVYKHPGNWLNYQRDMRGDAYDIVFDGPHFASWRIEHLGHRPVVKLPGMLQFHLVARAGDKSVNGPDDLVGRRICGMSPPNLSTLSMLAYYPNPIRQPSIRGVKGGMGQVHKVFLKDESCHAASLRTIFWNKKLSDEDKAGLKIIHTTKGLPNQVITVSRRITDSVLSRIRESVTAGAAKDFAQPIVARFGGKNAKAFVAATLAEYEGHGLLLENFVYGWQAQ